VFERLGSWTYRFRFLIVIAWVIAGVFMGVFAPSLAGSGSTDQTSFLPAGSPSKEAQQAIERAFPGSTSPSSATITLHRAGGLTAEDKAFRDEFAAWTTSPDAPEDLRAAVTETETADSRPELEELLRSEDRSFEILVINLDVADAGDEATAVVEQLREHLVATTPPGLETHVTGAAAISSDYLEAVKVGTDSTTMVTVVLVVIVLLAIYRAPLAALIPLITIGGAFVVSTGILGFLAAAGWQVSSTLATFLVVMVFGVGTDYAIFLISRYREEVSGGGDWHDAARTTVRRIGAVITASAGTVIVGMLAMGVGDFKMIASMGPGIAIAVAVTLVAGLTLAPALLSSFGHYLFWPLHTRQRHEGEPRGFFASLASAVSHRPAVVTVALLVLLIVPILYVPQARTNFDVMTDLPADSDSRLGYEAIAEHLGEDKLVQSTALIDAGGGRDMLAPAQMAKLHDLLVSLHETGGIATTTSLITPDGDTTIPDGFRPSATLREMADGFEGDDSADTSDNAGLLDDDVRDGLNQSLDYVNGVGVAFPDVAAGTAFREAQDGLEHALRIVDRVRDQSVLSTQLRTLSSSITSPANAAGGSDDDSTLMSDYLEELGAAFPEVRTLDAYKDGVRAARSLEQSASIDSALALSKAFDRLADHFDDQPDARLSPESLAGTSSAKQLKAEAEQTFGDLPDQLAALSSVFATRPDHT
jgi:RND superfamily putative drug exporter